MGFVTQVRKRLQMTVNGIPERQRPYFTLSSFKGDNHLSFCSSGDKNNCETTAVQFFPRVAVNK